MENAPTTKVESKKIGIQSIQKFLFYVLLLLVPITILPFPWDWTERGMGILILSFSTLIIGLQVLKTFVDGKFTILKSSIDVGVFILILTFLLSTVFSKDISSSIWGIDNRIGGGLISLISVVLLSFSVRTFLLTEYDIKKAFLFFLVGMFVNNLLSILSFLGVNIWGLLPIYNDLHQEGLPIVRSSKLHIFLNGISTFLNIYIIGSYVITKKGPTSLILSCVFLFVSIVNIIIFSLNTGIGLVILISLLLLLLVFVVLRRIRFSAPEAKNLFTILLTITLVLIIVFVLLQIPAVRSAIIPKSINIVAQVTLGLDISWKVATSVLVNSLRDGIFGLGPESYSIAYNMFKPLSPSLLNFNNVNFYYSGNEITTQFASGGLLWLFSWVFFGIVIVKSVIVDFLKTKQYVNVSMNWGIMIVNLTILFIYLGSLFSPYFVILTLLLFVLVSLRCILRDILYKGTADRFVMKLWTANLDMEATSGKKLNNFNILLSAILVTIVGALVALWISKGVSSIYVLKAESYFISQNRKYEGDKYPSVEDREVFTNNMANYYSKALKLDSNNSLYSRKKGLMYLEKVGIAAERYSNVEEQESRDSIIRDVGMWKNFTIDSIRKSIDISPAVYGNWEAMARVYMGLVGMGFYDYVADSVYALDKAIELNPTNYELYYSKAQIFVIKSQKDDALATLTKSLSINPQHIPSIILAGDLNKEKGNIPVYESYLKAAKKILEAQGNTTLEIYNEINKQLNSLPQKSE